MTQRRLGLTIPVGSESLSELPAVLAAAKTYGYTDVWTSEVAGSDAFTPLTMAATLQPDLRLGTAIASAFARSPALLTMSAAALADVGAAEVCIGIGASSNVIVSEWHGVAYERPYERVRDVLRFMKRALTGERVTFTSPSFSVDGFRLSTVPARQPKLLVAALREGMLKLAGRESDGVILNWLSPSDVSMVTRYVLDANPQAEVVARLPVVIAEDRNQARQLARRQIAAYLNVPVYAEYQRWLGRADILEPMWQAWSAGDRAAAVAAIPASLVDDLFLTGSASDVAAGVARFVDAGVTSPVLALFSAADQSSVQAFHALGAMSPRTAEAES